MGMYSVHNNHREDRKFWLYCGSIRGIRVVSGWNAGCRWTDNWQNWYDGNLNFQAPKDNVITGMSSEHSNRHEDRRYKFLTCPIRKDYGRRLEEDPEFQAITANLLNGSHLKLPS